MISVIVPNYNHAPYLRQRIDSILNQTYQDFELILLDDCSTDNSQEILLSYKDNPHVSHIVLNERNTGSPFAQWNRGIELARGEWIWIAESDDWADLDFLEVLMQNVSCHSNCGFVYTHSRYVDRNGNLLWDSQCGDNVIETLGEVYISERLLYACDIVNVSMALFKKEIIEAIDFTPMSKMHLCGDWLVYTEVLARTDVLEICSSHNNYRQHATNTSNWAETSGLTFIEGYAVLSRVTDLITIPSRTYARAWGRRWAEYSKKFGFSLGVNLSICCKYISRFPLIVYWGIIYFIRNLIK